MARQINIIDAIRNRRLFGSLPRFKNLETWTSWLVVLKAIFGLPMTADDLVIFNRHTGRTSPPQGGSKETYLIIGRRGGKSFISALITCFIACFIDFSPYITVGETLAVMCLAKDKDQARIVFRYVKAILNHVPGLRSMIIDQRADEIELSTGVTIMVKASDFGGVRGPTIPCVVADEIAFWPSQGANPNDEVLSAIRPALATIPDAKLLCISTGYAQVGALYDAHKQHYGKDDNDVLVWQADTATMNPTISPTFIDKEIEKDPGAGRAEWLGLFREDVSAAFPLEVLESCIILGRLELPPSPHVLQYFGFADPSGGRHDGFTLAIAHLDCVDRVILDAVRATRPPFDPAELVKEYCEFLKAYHVLTIIGDAYAGEWPKAEFAKHGITYELCEKTKSELYLATIPVFTSKRIDLLDIEKMKTEFRRLERRRGRSGKDTIDHPPRGSDDIANAVAGVTCLTLEHGGQFVMPEAYGEITCSDLTFYREGLAQGPTRDRYW
jgi:Terminase large subunit, ATPase domain